MIQNIIMKNFLKFLFIITAFNFQAFSQEFSQTRPVVNSITASKVDVNKINIKWDTPSNFNAASIAVYRSSKPFSGPEDILSSRPVAEIPGREKIYTDTLTKYGDYYYALISRDGNGKLFDIVVPGANATINPVTLSSSKPEKEIKNPVEPKYQPAYLRDLPLPYLDFISDIDRKPTALNEQALRNAKILSGKYFKYRTPLMEPYVFEEDLICAPEGDDYYLFQSLKTYFIKKDYKNSVSDLKKFLTVTRDPYTTTRAVFYLAESQYFCRNYRSALQLFLFLEDELPEISKKWVDSTLDQYTIPAN